MQIITDLSGWQNPHEGTIVALGVFDGIHLGHRRVIDIGLEWARERKLPFGVVTFDRIPGRVLSNSGPGLLLSVEHRLSLLEEIGCEFVLLLRFSRSLARLTPQAFAERVLHAKLHAKGIIVGYDQRFGRGAQGDRAMLEELGKRLGFEVRSAPAVSAEGRVVSSTRIRDAIESGRIEEAARLLGRPVSCRGTAHFLDDLSRRLKHPTFWLDLHHEVRPPSGVYAARIQSRSPEGTFALCNVSTVRRSEHGPSSDSRERAVELCFERETGDLDSREAEILLLGLIRRGQPLPNDELLRRQIACDFDRLREISRSCPPARR